MITFAEYRAPYAWRAEVQVEADVFTANSKALPRMAPRRGCGVGQSASLRKLERVAKAIQFIKGARIPNRDRGMVRKRLQARKFLLAERGRG